MLPLNFNFAQDVLDKVAAPQRTALIFVDDAGHRRDYTFAEVCDRSQRYAAALRAFGIERGDRVLLCASNTAKCVFTVLGLARLGAVAVPSAEKLDLEQLLERARRASVNAVIAGRKRRPAAEAVRDAFLGQLRCMLIGETREGWARLDTLADSARPFRGVTTQSTDMALVFDDQVLDYGAVYEMRALASDTLDAGASDRVWAAFPMGSEQWLALLQAPWWRGAAAVVHEAAFDARERLNLVRESQITILCQPLQDYGAQLDLPDASNFRVPHLRRCIVAGDAHEAGIESRWLQKFGVPLSSL